MKRERSLIKANSLKSQESYLKKMLILCIITVFIIFGACTLFGSLMTSAHMNGKADSGHIVRYKSIEINHGDTLWDIAETYMAKDGNSVAKYVAELKSVNSLKGDQIEAGHNLIIPY